MISFHSRRRARREAAQWVARLGGGAGEQDHAAFRTWYESDPRNAEAYDRMAAIWSASRQLSMAKPAKPAASAPRQRRLALALAASILAMAAVVFMLRGAVPGGGEPPVSFAATGDLREIVLPDRSRVLLDAGSRIELAFSGSERRILLREGRARFTVAHEARPFIVQADRDQVVATGTVFDVSLLDDRLSVVLLEGSVEVRQSRSRTAPGISRLTAGHRLVLGGQGGTMAAPVTRSDTSWASRMLVFDDLPLGQAVDMANRYSSTRIKLGDAMLRNLRVTGTYRAGDTAGLARSLAVAFGLRLSIDPDRSIRLSREAPAR